MYHLFTLILGHISPHTYFDFQLHQFCTLNRSDHRSWKPDGKYTVSIARLSEWQSLLCEFHMQPSERQRLENPNFTLAKRNTVVQIILQQEPRRQAVFKDPPQER